MKILSVVPLAIPEVKVVRFARFRDARGYFAESYRAEDFQHDPDLPFLHERRFVQTNESYSRAGTVRGLHFQWDPPQGKLVRTLHGRMIDIVVDIRKDSPTAAQALMYDLRNDEDADFGEWIWVPPGFAHGTWFPQASRIEYLCSAVHNSAAEGAISVSCPELDWSACDGDLKAEFDRLRAHEGLLMSDKDRSASRFSAWQQDPRSNAFTTGG